MIVLVAERAVGRWSVVQAQAVGDDERGVDLTVENALPCMTQRERFPSTAMDSRRCMKRGKFSSRRQKQ
jgi:hypothetical protein